MGYPIRSCSRCNEDFRPFVHNQKVCDTCTGINRQKECKWCNEIFTPTTIRNDYCSKRCQEFGNRAGRSKRFEYFSKEVYHQYKDITACQICGSEGFSMSKREDSEKLCIDHCHNTGIVRGKLCHNCNRALGLLGDDTDILRKAITYLERAETIRKE